MLDSTESSEVVVDSVVFVSLSDGLKHGFGGDGGSGEVSSGLGLGGDALEGGSLRISDKSLLWLGLTAGEEDELFLVAVKSIHVHLELVLAGVGAAVVNRDSDGLGESGAQLGGGQLLEGETTSVADLSGVLPGGGRDDGAELLEGAREGSCGLGLTELMTLVLARGLVEVGVDESSDLPVFAEMDVRNNVVVLGHWRFIYSIINKRYENDIFFSFIFCALSRFNTKFGGSHGVLGFC